MASRVGYNTSNDTWFITNEGGQIVPIDAGDVAIERLREGAKLTAPEVARVMASQKTPVAKRPAAAPTARPEVLIPGVPNSLARGIMAARQQLAAESGAAPSPGVAAYPMGPMGAVGDTGIVNPLRRGSIYQPGTAEQLAVADIIGKQQAMDAWQAAGGLSPSGRVRTSARGVLDPATEAAVASLSQPVYGPTRSDDPRWANIRAGMAQEQAAKDAAAAAAPAREAEFISFLKNLPQTREDSYDLINRRRAENGLAPLPVPSGQSTIPPPVAAQAPAAAPARTPAQKREQLIALARKERLGLIPQGSSVPLFIAEMQGQGNVPSPQMWALDPKGAQGMAAVDVASQEVKAKADAAAEVLKKRDQEIEAMKQQHAERVAQMQAEQAQRDQQHKERLAELEAQRKAAEAAAAESARRYDEEKPLRDAQAGLAQAQTTAAQQQNDVNKPAVAAQSTAANAKQQVLATDPTADMDPAQGSTYWRSQAQAVPKDAFKNVEPTLQNAPDAIKNFLRHAYNNRQTLLNRSSFDFTTDETDFENYVVRELAGVGGLTQQQIRALAEQYHEEAGG